MYFLLLIKKKKKVLFTCLCVHSTRLWNYGLIVVVRTVWIDWEATQQDLQPFLNL